MVKHIIGGVDAVNCIDLHCDTLTECYKRRLALKNNTLHFSLDKPIHPFRLCQAMAVFMPDDLRGDAAFRYFNAVRECFELQMKQFGDEISQVLDISQIPEALNERRFAAILTVEGGSALGGRLENLDRLYEARVRMMTLTWNAENEIAGGADTSIGFSPFGREVASGMERLGMAVDVSHLSDKAFWELCEFAEKPFAASHSNSRKICGHRRNLTDEMFEEIVNRGGVVGLNYCKSFLREDGKDGDVGDLLRHVHHFLDLGGENTLALGSDFDGTDVPGYLGGIERLGYLAEALEKSGIPANIVGKILFDNANRYFENLYSKNLPGGKHI